MAEDRLRSEHRTRGRNGPGPQVPKSGTWDRPTPGSREHTRRSARTPQALSMGVSLGPPMRLRICCDLQCGPESKVGTAPRRTVPKTIRFHPAEVNPSLRCYREASLEPSQAPIRLVTRLPGSCNSSWRECAGSLYCGDCSRNRDRRAARLELAEHQGVWEWHRNGSASCAAVARVVASGSRRRFERRSLTARGSAPAREHGDLHYSHPSPSSRP